MMSDPKELWLDPGVATNNMPAWGEMYPRQQTTFGEDRNYSDWTADAADTLSAVGSVIAPNLSQNQRPWLESAMLDAGNWLQFPEAGALKTGMSGIPLAMGLVNPKYRNIIPPESYRKILDYFADRPGVIIPRVPDTLEEPLIVKTIDNSIQPLLHGNEYLKSQFPDITPDTTGLWMGLWPRPSQAGPGTGGDLIFASTGRGMERGNIWHELTHWLQDRLTGLYNNFRPVEQRVQAKENYWNALKENIPYFHHSMLETPEIYEKSARAAWQDLTPGARRQYGGMWNYGADQERMANEFIADLAGPAEDLYRTIPELGGTPEHVIRYQRGLKQDIPELGAFWNTLEAQVPPDVLWKP